MTELPEQYRGSLKADSQADAERIVQLVKNTTRPKNYDLLGAEIRRQVGGWVVETVWRLKPGAKDV